MEDEILIKKVQTMFSLYGLTITKKLSNYVATQLRSINGDSEKEEWLTHIAEQLLNQNLQTPNIEMEHLKRAILECVRPEASLKDTETIFNVINAFDIPKVQFEIGRKKFIIHNVDKDLYPDAIHKSNLFKDRLDLLYYRTLRHPLFSPSRFGETDQVKLELVPIEYVLSEAKTENVYVIGLLSQLTEGQFYLEDSHGSVKVDLRKANFKNGLIMEGSVVIASGSYIDNVFEVQDIGFPPPEPSSNTRAAFGDLNTFGGQHPTSLNMSEKLRLHEQSNLEDTIVFLSEFYVDDIKVLEKFKEVLRGYSDFPPIAFVLCGHFLSFPPNATSAQKLKDGFMALADIITQHPDILKVSKFIIVPGPYDLGAPKILPRASLPKSILSGFIKKVPGTILATNPCRIQYCTKEIVVLREDILTKLCRNTLKFLDTANIFEHYAKSVICQSHLIPLTLQAMPVYWKFDHALQLFPTPDLIVVADAFAPYNIEYNDCSVINPGSFSKVGYPFKVYAPAEKVIESCELND